MEKTRRNVLQDPEPTHPSPPHPGRAARVTRGPLGAEGQDPREGLRAGVALMAPGDGEGWDSGWPKGPGEGSSPVATPANPL